MGLLIGILGLRISTPIAINFSDIDITEYGLCLNCRAANIFYTLPNHDQ